VNFTSNGGNSRNAVTGAGAVVPVAAFAGTPTSGSAPLTVTFTDSSIGTITNRFWDLGDLTTTNASSLGFAHTYTIAGTNSVMLRVTGPLGTNSLSLGSYIVVTNLGPVMITIQLLGDQLELEWSSGTLQLAMDLKGPYADLANATSPYKLAVSNTAQFFRVKLR
jgi:PKD repeat protein